MDAIITINTRYHFKSVPSQACLGRSFGGGFGLRFSSSALTTLDYRLASRNGELKLAMAPTAALLRPIVHSNHGSGIVVIPRDKW